MAENKSKNTDDTSKDSGEAQVQEKVDEANDQGFLGSSVDPTPRENYTVGGVIAGKPTPETDESAAKRAEQRDQS